MAKKIHPLQRTPAIIEYQHSQIDPIYTIVMPIYNQKENLDEVIKSINESSTIFHDMILINDGSSDGTQEKVEPICQNLKDSNKVCNIKIITNPLPIYETACDNQGFRNAKTEYIIEIQADIIINEQGFDAKMISAMDKFNLCAVSGRHVHDFSYMVGKYYETSSGVGLLGEKIFSKNNLPEQGCYIGETVARGPWLVRKSDLVDVSYLDEENFFLGHDDHDYHRRVYELKKKLTGYVPINIYSIANNGSCRRKRSGLNKLIYHYLKMKKKGSAEYLDFLKNHDPYCSIKRYSLI